MKLYHIRGLYRALLGCESMDYIAVRHQGFCGSLCHLRCRVGEHGAVQDLIALRRAFLVERGLLNCHVRNP